MGKGIKQCKNKGKDVVDIKDEEQQVGTEEEKEFQIKDKREQEELEGKKRCRYKRLKKD